VESVIECQKGKFSHYPNRLNQTAWLTEPDFGFPKRRGEISRLNQARQFPKSMSHVIFRTIRTMLSG